LLFSPYCRYWLVVFQNILPTENLDFKALTADFATGIFLSYFLPEKMLLKQGISGV